MKVSLGDLAMKRLLLLTAVTMMLAGTTGCRCCDWLFRGSRYGTVPQNEVIMAEPYNPCATPAAPMCGSACDAALPGPGSYMAPN